MAVFTKTYVQCDLCEAQRELPMNGEAWYRVEASVHRLGGAAGGSATPGDKVSARTSDICPDCYSAVHEGEFSSLFVAERTARPKVSPVNS